MQPGPLEHEPHLARRQSSVRSLGGRNVDDGLVVACPCVKVRGAVVPDVHVDHDAVEGGKPGHELTLPTSCDIQIRRTRSRERAAHRLPGRTARASARTVDRCLSVRRSTTHRPCRQASAGQHLGAARRARITSARPSSARSPVLAIGLGDRRRPTVLLRALRAPVEGEDHRVRRRPRRRGSRRPLQPAHDR